MRPWRPSSIAQGVLAVFAGGCAVWSWTHGDHIGSVIAFALAWVFTCFALSSERHVG